MEKLVEQSSLEVIKYSKDIKINTNYSLIKNKHEKLIFRLPVLLRLKFCLCSILYNTGVLLRLQRIEFNNVATRLEMKEIMSICICK